MLAFIFSVRTRYHCGWDPSIAMAAPRFLSLHVVRLNAILLSYYQMETMAETNRILQSANNNTAATEPKKTKKVKKKKVVSSRVQPKRQPSTPSGTRTSEHYRLHLAEIPFVAGTVSVQLAVFTDLLERNGNWSSHRKQVDNAPKFPQPSESENHFTNGRLNLTSHIKFSRCSFRISSTRPIRKTTRNSAIIPIYYGQVVTRERWLGKREAL